MSLKTPKMSVPQIILQPEIEDIVLLDLDTLRRQIEDALKPKPAQVTGSQRFHIQFYEMVTSNIVGIAGGDASAGSSIQCYGIPDSGTVSSFAMLHFDDKKTKGDIRPPELDPSTGKLKFYFHQEQISMVLAQLARGHCFAAYDVVDGLPAARIENEPMFLPT